MRFLKALVVAATTLSVVASPVRFTRREQDANLLVLQFASVLENLESQFYQQGIQKFSDSDFQNAGFTSTAIVSEQLTTIQGDEATHLDFLKKSLSAVGSSAPDNCQFNFDSALTSVEVMAATARVVELVGVMAYLGAASLITDPQILVAAGGILTVEARHQTILNAMSGIGSPIAQPFDLALAPGEVLAIAGGFIQGCDLGIPANKPLTVTNSAPPQIGDLVQFSFDGMSGMNNLHCQMLIAGSVNSISLPIEKCNVPQGVNGAVAIFITSDQQPLPNDVVNRPLANNLVAGPVVVFIDSQPSALSQLLRAGASSGGSFDTSSNITLDQASQIISEGSSSSDVSGSSSSESGPNFNTGAEAGGVIIVEGWTNLPSQDQSQSQDNSMNSYQSQDSNSMQSGDSMNSMQSEDSMNSMDQNMNSYQSGNSDSMQSEDSMNSMDSMNQSGSSGSMQSGDSMNSMNSMDQSGSSDSMQSGDSMNSMNSMDQSGSSDSMQSGDSMNSMNSMDQSGSSDSMQSGDSMNSMDQSMSSDSMQSGDSMQNQDMNDNQDNSGFDLSGSSSDSSTEAPASSDGSS